MTQRAYDATMKELRGLRDVTLKWQDTLRCNGLSIITDSKGVMCMLRKALNEPRLPSSDLLKNRWISYKSLAFESIKLFGGQQNKCGWLTPYLALASG